MWDLDEDKQAFVDAVLAPLPPDDAMRGRLEQTVQVAGGMLPEGGTPEAREAAARMQATAPGYRRRRLLTRALGWALMLGIAWVTLAAPAARLSLGDTLDTSELASRALPRFLREALSPGSGREVRRMAERIAPDHLFTAMGDLSQKEQSLRWKAVWDRYPENPAHFMTYAVMFRQAEQKWPDDLVTTGERLDPANGWFRWLSVMARSQDVVEAARPAGRTWSSKTGSVATPAVPDGIKDQAGVQEVLASWDRALAMSHWNSYRAEQRLLRLEGVIPPEDYADHVSSFYFAATRPNEDNPFSRSISSFCATFIRVLAEDYAARGDRESLDALAGRFIKTLGRVAEGPPDIKQRLLLYPAGAAAESLAAVYGKMGDTAQETRFLNLFHRLEATARKPPTLTTPDALDQKRGSMLASGYAVGGRRLTPVDERDLRGGRLAEYAVIEGVLMHELVLLMCIAVLCLVPLGWKSQRLGSRLCDLLRPVDRAWIMGLGVLLPAVVYLLCMRLPWLELRDFTLDYGRIKPLIALSCGLLLSFLLCTAEVTHWRLSRRAAIAGFGWHGLKPGRWIAALVLMSMPAAVSAHRALAKWARLDDHWLKAVYLSLAALPLLWIIWMCVAFFAGSAERRLQRVTVVRAMLPHLIVATLLGALAIPALYQEEKYWTRRISYEAVNVANSLFNSGEDAYAKWAQEQLVAALAEFKQAAP